MFYRSAVPMNTALKVAIVKAGMTQRALARRIRLDEAILSRVVRGKWNLTEPEKARLAKALGSSLEEIGL